MRRKTFLLILLAAAAMLISIGTPFSGAQEKPVARALPAGWTTPVNISNLGGGSEAPTIAVDDNGRVFAAWTEWYGGVGSPRAMVYNSTNAAGQWGGPQEAFLLYPNIDDVGYPSIACTATGGTAMMVYHDADYSIPAMGIFAQLFKNGTFDGEGFVPGLHEPASYVTIARNPVDGLFYLIFQYDYSGNITFELAEFSFNPATGQWNALGLVHGLTGSSRYWPYLVFDAKGTAHLIYITRSPAMVYYCKNTTPSNPNAWTAPINLSFDTARDWVAARMAADNDGDVYVAWYGNTGGYESATEEVWFKKTVNGVWQPNFNLTENTDRSEGPSVAVDPATKNIYIAYHEYHSGSSWDVMLKTYDSMAKTWSQPVTITENSGHDGEPCIRVDKTGGLHLAYHYTQADGNMEIYYTTLRGASARPEPPRDFALASRLDASKTKKINRLSWTNDPANAGLQLTGTRIYRKLAGAGDETFAPIGTASSTATQYEDQNLDIATKYSYGATVLAADGEESDPSSIVVEGVWLPEAPKNLALASRLDASGSKKIVRLTWTNNPANAGLQLASTRIYRKLSGAADSAFAFIGSVSATATQYEDSGLDIPTKYVFRAAVLAQNGEEGLPGQSVSEPAGRQFELPPLSPAVSSAINRILFYREKRNTITYMANPGNPTADISGYEIYRKLTTEADSALSLLVIVGATTTSYTDAKLSTVQNYSYAVKTKFSDGKTSEFSTVVADK